MNNGVMGDGNIVPYIHRCYFVSAMHHHTVLDVNIVTNPDAMDITPDNSIKPYTAAVSDNNVTYDCGIIGKETVISQPGVYSVNRFYQSHVLAPFQVLIII
jgi:hypothetical protein